MEFLFKIYILFSKSNIFLAIVIFLNKADSREKREYLSETGNGLFKLLVVGLAALASLLLLLVEFDSEFLNLVESDMTVLQRLGNHFVELVKLLLN